MAIDTVLRQADIFVDLTGAQLALIASICEERQYQMGDVLFEENSRGDELFVIASGEIEIQVNPATIGGDEIIGPQTIATLRRGQSFGEVALVDEGLRSASARCSQHETSLVVIPRGKLMDLCEEHPELGYRLMRNLATDLALKVRNIDLQVRAQFTWERKDKS